MELDQYRRESLENWATAAPAWERHRDFTWQASRAVGERLVAALAPQEGQTILEVAAGPGDTGFAAAALVGERGRLISTDFSPEMVEIARRRAAELGIRNVEFRVMDAERMDLEDHSVDGVLCRWGYMLMADPEAALRETRRVLRPGGRVAFSVWGPQERNPWAVAIGRVMIERGHMPPPDPTAPSMFALGDRARIREVVTAAGFGEPEIEDVDVSWLYADFEEYWRVTTEMGAKLAQALTELDEEERRAVRGAAQQAVEPYRSNGGYEIGGVCLNVLAS